MGILDFFRKKSEQYVGIRYSATGVFGYSFCSKNGEAFHVMCPVVPNPDIYLSGFRQKLIHSRFNGQLTLFPGVRRDVTDESGRICGSYIFLSPYEFCITAEACATVRLVDGGWEVWEEAKKTADIRRIPQERRTRFTENGCDMEPWFEVTVTRDASPALLPYIFAIPMLGF